MKDKLLSEHWDEMDSRNHQTQETDRDRSSIESRSRFGLENGTIAYSLWLVCKRVIRFSQKQFVQEYTAILCLTMFSKCVIESSVSSNLDHYMCHLRISNMSSMVNNDC